MGLVTALGATLLACGGPRTSGDCPNDLPASCPSPSPSYQTTVAPIINLRCVTCHSPGGQEASRPLQTYSQVYSERSAVLNQVYACNMPPGSAAQPTEQEREALLGWLVCGAPQN
ncbi:MAG TPA: hypothetical protein VFI53_12560 [Myxococcaceae bacterium]|nr:hypothetical protein [Myxococcaceae bacterium]